MGGNGPDGYGWVLCCFEMRIMVGRSRLEKGLFLFLFVYYKLEERGEMTYGTDGSVFCSARGGI